MQIKINLIIKKTDNTAAGFQFDGYRYTQGDHFKTSLHILNTGHILLKIRKKKHLLTELFCLCEVS